MPSKKSSSKESSSKKLSEHFLDQKIDTKQEGQKFYKKYNSDDDVPPEELSGEQNTTKSLFFSDIPGEKANFLLTVTTTVKTVIGAGILSLPYTVKKLGFVLAIILFLLVSGVSYISSVLLVNSKNLSRHSNYSTILYNLHQSKWSKALGSSLVLLKNVGICIAELIIFKTSIRKIIKNVSNNNEDLMNQFYTSEIMIILVIAILELPLTLKKKIQKLKMFALMGVGGILIFMLCLVIHFFMEMSNRNWDIGFSMQMFPTDWYSAAAVVPNLIFALGYQVNFFPIYKGMEDVNDSKIKKASLASVLWCGLSYLLVGILGYSLYGNSNSFQANFLLSIDYNHSSTILFYGMNLGFIVSVLFSFPVMFFGARNNFMALIGLLTDNGSEGEEQDEKDSDNERVKSSYIEDNDRVQRRKRANIRFLISTFILYGIILVIGVWVDDIQIVFNFVGAVCSTSITILLPCYFYFKLIDRNEKPKKLKYYYARVLFVVMIPYALFSIVAKYIG